MTRTIKVASIQMDVAPAPLKERLARAERLANEAAQAGAKLIAFPEVFNTGYVYSPENYALAEPLDGPTFTWMRQTAARLNVHLAGSILLRDQTDIYNALLLVSPDGRFWRYNKNYPWGWERAYFRDDHQTVVAHTDLGDIGMLICWDWVMLIYGTNMPDGLTLCWFAVPRPLSPNRPTTCRMAARCKPKTWDRSSFP
jgi:predicted amidohydrolase